MNKLLGLILVFFFGGKTFASTPDAVIAGSMVNEWSQAGLKVTIKGFDLGIGGKGFFVLQNMNGDETYSRHGAMHLDPQGFLVHTESQNLVVGYCGDSIGPINLANFVRDPSDNSSAIQYRTELDGSIVGIYRNGRVHKLCQLALALFSNPKNLSWAGKHTLNATQNSGTAYLDRAEKDGRGSIHASSLEELDETIYSINLPGQSLKN